MKTQHLPDWVLKARSKWEYRGNVRPPFAIEPKPGQLSVWDFPRPPAVKPVKNIVSVYDGKSLITETKNALMVLETGNPPTYYIPPKDVNIELLTQMEKTSWCEWKGKARYWALKENPDQAIAWDYPVPFPEYKLLANYLSFYPHNFQCFVGDEQITPQDSKIYAGWITKDLVGPFKGQPGSENW
ncbi:MAG: DUF427 domain-containing protein [Gelidibacter sp.]|nr:DUF427 domain-containing protein [Gelidibacter sp.]